MIWWNVILGEKSCKLYVWWEISNFLFSKGTSTFITKQVNVLCKDTNVVLANELNSTNIFWSLGRSNNKLERKQIIDRDNFGE